MKQQSSKSCSLFPCLIQLYNKKIRRGKIILRKTKKNPTKNNSRIALVKQTLNSVITFLYSIPCMKSVYQSIKDFQEGQKINFPEESVIYSPDRE